VEGVTVEDADVSTYAYRCAECGATVAIPIMAPDDAPYACEECGRSLTVAEWDREETER